MEYKNKNAVKQVPKREWKPFPPIEPNPFGDNYLKILGENIRKIFTEK